MGLCQPMVLLLACRHNARLSRLISNQIFEGKRATGDVPEPSLQHEVFTKIVQMAEGMFFQRNAHGPTSDKF